MICLLLLHKKRLRFLFHATLIILPAAAVCWFLSIAVRLPNHVLLPILLFINTAAFFMACPDREQGALVVFSTGAGCRSAAKTILFAVILLLYFRVGLLHWRYLDTTSHGNLSRHQAFKDLVEDLSTTFGLGKSGRQLFMVVGAAFPYEWSSPLNNFSEFRELVILHFGCNTHSPIYNALIKKFGIDNVYKALYERPDVWLICSSDFIDHLETFICEHYGERPQFEDQTGILTPTTPLVQDYLRCFRIFKGHSEIPIDRPIGRLSEEISQ